MAKKKDTKPLPKVKTVTRITPTQNAVIAAARECVDSNARESRVIALAEALNKLDEDTFHNPFGALSKES